MLSGLKLCSLCDFLNKWLCSRREQSLEILQCAVFVGERRAYIGCGVLVVVVGIHFGNNPVHDIGVKHLHIRQIFHMVYSVFLHVLEDYFVYNAVVEVVIVGDICIDIFVICYICIVSHYVFPSKAYYHIID